MIVVTHGVYHASAYSKCREDFVTLFQRLRERQLTPYKHYNAFLSYGRADEKFVTSLRRALEQRGRVVFQDKEHIPASAEWWEEIKVSIVSADTFIFVISNASITSTICRQEIDFALKYNKRIIPIRYGNVLDDALNPAIKKFNWILYNGPDQFDDVVERLDKAITDDLDWKRMNTRLTMKASEWDTRKQNKQFLLSGLELRAAEQHLRAAPPNHEAGVTVLQEQYVRASRQGYRRRQLRTSFIIAILVIVGIVGLLRYLQSENSRQRAEDTVTVAEQQRQTAEAQATTRDLEATARAITQHARMLREQDPQLLPQSVLMSVEAAQRTPRPLDEAYQTLFEGLSLLPVPLSERSPLNGGEPNQYSLDTRFKLLVQTSDNQVPQMAGLETSSRSVRELQVSGDGRIIDIGSGIEKSRIRLGTTTIGAVVFSPNGQYIAVSLGSFPVTQGMIFDQGMVKVWNVDSGQEVATFVHEYGYINAMSWSTDSRYIVTGGWDKSARVWEVLTQAEITKLTHNQTVYDVRFSPDGRFIATASGDPVLSPKLHMLQLWDVQSGQLSFRHEVVRSRIPVLKFTSNSRYLLGSSVVVDTNDMKIVKDFGSEIIAVSQNNQLLVTTNRIWRITDTDFTATDGPEVNVGQSVIGIFSPDGKYFASTGEDKATRVWETRSGREIWRIADEHDISPVAFDESSKVLVTCCHRDGMRFWIMNDFRRHAAAFYFSVSGQFGASIDSYQNAYIWSEFDGQSFRMQGVRSIGFSRDEQYAAIAGMDKSLHILNLEDGTMKEIDLAENVYIDQVTFSSSNKYIAFEGSNMIVVVDISSGRVVSRFVGVGVVTKIDFCDSDEKIVSLGDGNNIFVYSLAGKDVNVFENNVMYNRDLDICYSVDLKEETYEVWDTVMGDVVKEDVVKEDVSFYISNGFLVESEVSRTFIMSLRDNQQKEIALSLDDLRVSHSGKYAVTSDTIINLVDGTLTKFDSSMYQNKSLDISFSSNDRYLILSYMEDSRVSNLVLWQPVDLIESACSRVEQNLTEDEWKSYMPEGIDYRQTCANVR